MLEGAGASAPRSPLLRSSSAHAPHPPPRVLPARRHGTRAGDARVSARPGPRPLEDEALRALDPGVPERETAPPGRELALLRTIRNCLVILAMTATGAAIYFGKDIVMPIALGLLITLTLTPPVRWLRKRRLPAGLAAIAVVALVGTTVGTGAWFLSEPTSELVATAPEIGERIKERMRDVESTAGSLSEVGEQIDEIAGADEGTQVVTIKQPGLVSSATSTLVSGLTSLAVALVLALFMLGSGDLFYEKLVAVMPGLKEKKRALRIVRDVEGNVSRYLFTITLINAALGLAIGTGLALYGMPGAALWGVIAAVMNFLPFVGALIGGGLLAAVSVGHYDALAPALVPPAIYLSCTTIEGNVITPLIVGRRLEINVVAVFLAVAIWGWFWGIAGALMAVPLLVVFKVLCEHVEGLDTWGEFLAGPEDD